MTVPGSGAATEAPATERIQSRRRSELNFMRAGLAMMIGARSDNVKKAKWIQAPEEPGAGEKQLPTAPRLPTFIFSGCACSSIGKSDGLRSRRLWVQLPPRAPLPSQLS